MRKKSKKKIFGYLLILLGIALPLYGLSSLATSLMVDQKAYGEFSKSKPSQKAQERESKKIESYNSKLKDEETAIVDPFATEEYQTKYEILEDPDAVFAYLRIPVLDLIQPVRLDASKEHLAKGVAHIDGTSLPVGGEPSRSVIAGHRGYYQSIMFLNLADLESGDRVYIERNQEKLEYRVVDKEVINPWEWEKIMPIEGRDMLTLLTCDPFLPPRPQRLLVNCERVVQEVPLSKEDKKIKEASPSKKTLITKWVVLGGAGIGWLLLAFVAFKFLRYLSKKD